MPRAIASRSWRAVRASARCARRGCGRRAIWRKRENACSRDHGVVARRRAARAPAGSMMSTEPLPITICSARHLEPARERACAAERRAVGIAVHLAEHRVHGLDGHRRGPERVLVRGELDDVAQAELALDLARSACRARSGRGLEVRRARAAARGLIAVAPRAGAARRCRAGRGAASGCARADAGRRGGRGRERGGGAPGGRRAARRSFPRRRPSISSGARLNWPGSSPREVTGPIATRRSFETGWPTACSSRLTS